MSSICLWEGCKRVFEDSIEFKNHVDKHVQDQLLLPKLDNHNNLGIETKNEEEPVAKKAKFNENGQTNPVKTGRR
jgi:hypothetical protein